MQPEGDGNEAVRQMENTEKPFDAETDPAPAGVDGELDVTPAGGGYRGRDPKTEMPVVPSVEDTHDDGKKDDMPDTPDEKERDWHE